MKRHILQAVTDVLLYAMMIILFVTDIALIGFSVIALTL